MPCPGANRVRTDGAGLFVHFERIIEARGQTSGPAQSVGSEIQNASSSALHRYIGAPAPKKVWLKFRFGHELRRRAIDSIEIVSRSIQIKLAVHWLDDAHAEQIDTKS